MEAFPSRPSSSSTPGTFDPLHFPALPSPPPPPTSSLASALSLSLSPLLDFYLDAQQWASDARKSLEPESSPPPAAVLPPTPSELRHAHAADQQARRRRSRAYPYSKPPLPIIKPEPLSPTLAALALPAEPLPQLEPPRQPLENLLRAYEAMLWERVESCKRIEKLIGDSEGVLGGIEGVRRGRR